MSLILVIDDDEALRRTLRRTLERAGHTVIEAGDGNRGLEVLRAERPALVVTDLVMPDRDGIETIQAIRAEFDGVKIIAMSGAGRMDPEERLTDAELLGADATLRKPFELRDLRETIIRVLSPDP